MADITAAMVKQLREATNVSMMECKRALVEAGGDSEKAVRILRERGIAVAAKKVSRTANEGLIATAVTDSGRARSLLEVNCETAFVARNRDFQAFVQGVAERAAETDADLSDELKKEVTAKIAEIGENIIIRRNTRFVLESVGSVASYIHLRSKVGVLVEVGCDKPETAEQDEFKSLATDLTLHIAACAPQFLAPDDVPESVSAAEREIYATQVKDKPPQIVDKIVEGKIKKFYAEICLIAQGFVKEPKQSVSALLAEKGKVLDDTLTVRRFARYQLGA